ncbi:MAG: TIR domain-containing protein [Anaerolineae bacterium]
MADAFISYSRKDIEFVRNLHQALTTANREVWVDWKDIPLTANWRDEIRQGMEQAHAVIFILSPDFLASHECQVELSLAEELHKRLIPLVYRDVAAKEVSPSLAMLNWIFCRQQDNFDAAFKALTTSIDTDLDWVKAHTRLLIRAREWENGKRSDSFLLRRGAGLNEAEQMLAQADKEPELTTLQRQYILASRNKVNQQQRLILWAVSFGFVIAVALAITAFLQSREAEKQRGLAEQHRVEAESARDVAEAERDRAATAEIRAVNGEQQARQAQATAEAEREEAVRQSQISLAKSLVAQTVPIIQSSNNTELALLLAAEAGHLNGQANGDAQALVENALRQILSRPYFNLILREEGPVQVVTFSPDGQTLASTSESGNIILWDMQNLAARPRILVTSHRSRVSSLAFSPNGELLLSAGDDGTVHLLHLSPSKTTSTVLNDHTGRVLTVVFSPDGRTFASAGEDAVILLRQVADPEAAPTRLEGHTDAVFALAFSQNGQFLASAGADEAIKLWDLSRTTPEPTLLPGHSSTVLSLAFSPDGQTLASGSADQTIRLWDMTDPLTRTAVLKGHTGSVTALAFSPECVSPPGACGVTLASASFDKTVRLWEVSNWASLAGDAAGVLPVEPSILNGHENSVSALAFSPAGDMLASVSADRSVRLWRLTPPVAKPQVYQGQDWINGVAFSPDGQFLASASDDLTVRLWIVADPTAEPVIVGEHDDRARAVAFSSDGQTLASVGDDQTVRLWNIADPTQEPVILDDPDGGVRAVAFSPDGKLLASAGAGQTIRLWNPADTAAEPIVLSGHEQGITALAFGPEGQTLASASFDSTIRLWNLETPSAEPTVLKGHNTGVLALAFSPDGRTLASGGADGVILLWDMANLGVPPVTLSNHEDQVLALAFSPDGRRLASVSGETVKLWDTSQPGADPAALADHTGRVFTLSFSPSGETLASAGADQSIRVWLAQFNALDDLACQQVRRNLTAAEWLQFLGERPYRRTCPALPDPLDAFSLK